jgi:hypothetical protein
MTRAPVRHPSNVADEVLDVDDPVLEQVARAVGMPLARQLGAPPVTIRLLRFMGQRAARVVAFEPDIHQRKPKEET